MVADNFVQGVLEEMQGSYSIYYEMVFHLSTGHTMPVFYNYSRHEPKTDEQISSQLTVGASYEMLIIVRTRHPAYMPANPSGEAFELVDWEVQEGKTTPQRICVLQGKVLDPFWQAASQKYLAVVTPKIYANRYVLLETAIGTIVASYNMLEEDLGEQAKEIAVGGYLTWEPSRLDLLAILHKNTDAE